MRHRTYTVYCRVGWIILDFFYIFIKNTPEICYIPSKGTENSNKKFVPLTSSYLVMTFWVMHYIRLQHFFFYNMNFMGIQRRRILHRFQKYKRTLVTKCTLKKLFKKKEFLYYTGGPLRTDENLYTVKSFLGAFCH
jgi:hypothetical protein